MLLIILLDQYACTSLALKQTLSESYRSKGISLKKKKYISEQTVRQFMNKRLANLIL